MGHILVTDQNGAEHCIEAMANTSLMQIMRTEGIADILALCGGMCACGTCHVYVAPEQIALLPPVLEDEENLLSSLEARKANSRLSCQVQFQDSLDNLRLIVAPQE